MALELHPEGFDLSALLQAIRLLTGPQWQHGGKFQLRVESVLARLEQLVHQSEVEVHDTERS